VVDNVMEVYDTATNTLITRLNIGATTGVAFNRNGTRAYITSQTTQPGVVVVVDTATLQILKSYPVGNGPTDIALTPRDQRLMVNNRLDPSITVIDLLRNKTFTTKLDSPPSGLALIQ